MESKDLEKQKWVRLDPKIRDRASRLLVELVEASGKGRTREQMVRCLAETLAEHLPLREFEMGWGEGNGHFSFIRSKRVPLNQTESSEASNNAQMEWRQLSGILESSFVAAVWDGLRGKKVLVSLHSSSGKKQVILPFYEEKRKPGFVRFAWQKEETPEGDLSYAMFEPLRRLFMVAQKNLTLLEKVAQVSKKAHQDNKFLRQEANLWVDTPSIVAVSKKMRALLDQARRVARYDSTVLIYGESGTGKELLARRIHLMSRRSRKTFVRLNCGALPEGLIESELFGHEKGAFTGAVGRHIGCFESASGGTLFLDEVAALPLSVQVKLLEVLQEGKLTRVGGEEPILVDVRVIAATYQELETLVKEKTFREDLFFRLNVFPLSLPPLRERREDLSVLVHHIINKLAKKMNCPIPQICAIDLVKLGLHDWPGNIRELENVLERTLILSAGGSPSFSEALSLSLSLEVDPDTLPLFPPGREFDEEHVVMTWRDASRRCISNALHATNGKLFGKNGAAELLGLRPTTLQSKMKKLGIDRLKFVK